MIDNYDSFTYNLVQYFGELEQDVKVFRNDKITIDHIKDLSPSHIVISPGPCTPNEAGISIDVINNFKKEIPILGVCLGHQSIGQAYGGKITATRYHSLVIEKDTLPDCFEITAWTKNKDGGVSEIMGIKHKDFLISGVQFHPESILTAYGHELLGNFLSNTI